MEVRRLDAKQIELARRVLYVMAAVFENEQAELGDAYLLRLLSDSSFWVIAALTDQGEVMGGLTAHTLPMTVAEEDAVFLYDIAVRPEYQRCGVGRSLVEKLQGVAPGEVFVFADDEDTHALDFYRALGGAPLRSTMFTFGAR
jgi:aminoglycoside 3-N-acetyltransferase I